MIFDLFPKRINRIYYLSRVIAVGVCFYAISLAVSRLASPNRELGFYTVMVLVLVHLAYYFVGILVPRLRDIGMPPLMLALWFVPIAGQLLIIAALFAPSGWWQKVTIPTPKTNGIDSINTNEVSPPENFRGDLY